MLEFIIICCVVFIIAIGFIVKKPNKTIKVKDTNQYTDNKKNDAYTLYTDWCKKKNDTPIPREEFEKLANGQGHINLADVMDKHRNINSYQKEEEVEGTKNDSVNEDEQKLQEEKEEQKKRDEKFISSAITGYVTNSTTKGTILGGSLLGGMLGDYLNKKKKK